MGTLDMACIGMVLEDLGMENMYINTGYPDNCVYEFRKQGGLVNHHLMVLPIFEKVGFAMQELLTKEKWCISRDFKTGKPLEHLSGHQDNPPLIND